jgi:hypothetical protein
MIVNIINAKEGRPVYVLAIPGIKYGPFQMCLSTYNEAAMPKMKEAAFDCQRYIAECYKKGRPGRQIILPKAVQN